MYSIDKIKRMVDLVVIHCAATRPSMDWGAAEIDRVHRERGFLKCGYHIVIKRDGTIEDYRNSKARPFENTGAHVGDCGTGYNKRSLGVCLVGGIRELAPHIPENNFTLEQFASLRVVLNAISSAVSGSVEVLGHRDLIKRTNAPAKACPCFEVADFLKDRRFAEVDVTEDFTKNPVPTDPLAIRKHTVTKGESLWGISKLYGVTVARLKEINRLNGDVIHPNQTLKLY